MELKDPASPRFAQRLGVVAFNLKGAMPKRVADELIGALSAIAEKHAGTRTPLLSRREVRQQMTELAAASARRVYARPSIC